MLTLRMRPVEKENFFVKIHESAEDCAQRQCGDEASAGKWGYSNGYGRRDYTLLPPGDEIAVRIYTRHPILTKYCVPAIARDTVLKGDRPSQQRDGSSFRSELPTVQWASPAQTWPQTF